MDRHRKTDQRLTIILFFVACIFLLLLWEAVATASVANHSTLDNGYTVLFLFFFLFKLMLCNHFLVDDTTYIFTKQITLSKPSNESFDEHSQHKSKQAHVPHLLFVSHVQKQSFILKLVSHPKKKAS